MTWNRDYVKVEEIDLYDYLYDLEQLLSTKAEVSVDNGRVTIHATYGELLLEIDEEIPLPDDELLIEKSAFDLMDNQQDVLQAMDLEIGKTLIEDSLIENISKCVQKFGVIKFEEMLFNLLKE